jgi:hypothetical protein
MISSSEWSSSSGFPTKVTYESLYCPTHFTHYAKHKLHNSLSPVTRTGRYVCKNAHIHRQAELQGWPLSVVLGSECQCRREDGVRKLRVFMSLSSGFTV